MTLAELSPTPLQSPAPPLSPRSSLSPQPTRPRASPTPPCPSLEARFRLDHVSDDALHAGVKTLTGRHNALTAELLAHLAEVDARGIYRERACSSLYTYCVYELRLSEDEAQRRTKGARTAREYPVLFQMLAEGAIHLTGLLLVAPYLTRENHAELLARARFRTKREIEHLVAEIAPRPDVPARIEPLGPRPTPKNSWQAYMAALRGSVRELVPGVGRGQAPPVPSEEPVEDADLGVESCGASNAGVTAGSPAPPARVDAPRAVASKPLAPVRYRVEFTASERYAELLEEARDLLQHQVPDRDVARVHELAMEAFVEELRKRRRAERSKRSGPARGNRTLEGPAPERIAGTPDASAPARVQAPGRYVPAEIRRAVWQRDEGRCTFEDSGGRRCHERAGLEIHHEHAFALGGETTLENLRLLCRSHNALLAERDFGRAHVERMKNRRLKDSLDRSGMARRGRDWNEENLSESCAVRQLEALGYGFVSAETLEAERESLKDVVLTKRLARALVRLNPWLSDDNVQKAVRDFARTGPRGRKK